MKANSIKKWLLYTSQYKKTEFILEDTLKLNFNLSLNEFYVLYYLGDTPNHCIKLSEISKYFNLSQSAMSRMMMRMENSPCGVIERRSCPDDKRGIYIHLTSKGQSTLNSARILVEQTLKNNSN